MYQTWVLTALLVWPLIAAAVVVLAPERLGAHLGLGATGEALGTRRHGDRAGHVGTAVVAVPARRGDTICRAGAVDPRVGNLVHHWHRRHLAVPGAAHDVSRAALGARQLHLHHQARTRVLRQPAGADDRDDRRLRGARSVPVLRDVGSDADPDVLHHRDLGRGQPALRGDQVLHLYDVRVAVDAGRDPRAVPLGPRPHRPVLVRLCLPAAERGAARRHGGVVLPRLLPGVRDQGADVPVPHLAPRRARRGADGGLGDPGGGAAQDGHLWIPAIRVAVLPTDRAAPRGSDGDRGALAHRDRLRWPGGDGATRLP